MSSMSDVARRPVTSTQTCASGSASARGERRRGPRCGRVPAVRPGDAPDRRRRRPPVQARGSAGRPRSARSRSAPPVGRTSGRAHAGRGEHTPTPVEQERRRHGRDGHDGRDEEHADHDPRRLARGPRLERLDDEPVAERPVLERLGDELEVGVGRRVDLVVEAVDRRRPVRREDREPDGHADHARDGHGRRGDAVRPRRDRLDGRGRARRHRQPEPGPEHGERERGARRSACPGVQPAISEQARRSTHPSPTSVTSRSGSSRTANPDTRAPNGRRARPAPRARAAARRRRRTAPGPRTPPPPTIAVANP